MIKRIGLACLLLTAPVSAQPARTADVQANIDAARKTCAYHGTWILKAEDAHRVSVTPDKPGEDIPPADMKPLSCVMHRLAAIKGISIGFIGNAAETKETKKQDAQTH